MDKIWQNLLIFTIHFGKLGSDDCTVTVHALASIDQSFMQKDKESWICCAIFRAHSKGK